MCRELNSQPCARCVDASGLSGTFEALCCLELESSLQLNTKSRCLLHFSDPPYSLQHRQNVEIPFKSALGAQDAL